MIKRFDSRLSHAARAGRGCAPGDARDAAAAAAAPDLAAGNRATILHPPSTRTVAGYKNGVRMHSDNEGRLLFIATHYKQAWNNEPNLLALKPLSAATAEALAA